MALDFPGTPTLGQTFQSAAGSTWQWDGSKWLPQATGLPPLATNTGRNLLHNSMFSVFQRGFGPWTTTVAYTADRWFASLISDTVSFTVFNIGDAGRAQIGDEAAVYGLANTFTGNSAAGAYSEIVQAMEGVRRLAGKTVIVSFWAVAGSGTPKLGLNFWINYGTGGSPSAAQWGQPNGVSVTLNTTWTRYSVVLTPASSAGKTFGTTPGTDNIQLCIGYSSGATNNAGFGNIGVQSGAISLWGVQLEIVTPGQTQPTPLEKLDPRIELGNCHRFFESFIIAPDYTSTITSPYIMRAYRFATTKRTTPSITTSNMNYYSNGVVTACTVTVYGTSPDYVSIGNNSLTNANGFYTGTINASADF